MYAHGIGRMPAEPDRRRRDRRHDRVAVERVAGQERREVLPHRDRPDAGTAATVRDAERLVQVQVRHVGTEAPRRGEADERVEVRAVDVDLPAVLVDEVADLGDRDLEDAVGRRVGRPSARRARRRAPTPSP